MDADEEIARKLQEQFDEEAAAAESQMLLDRELAQRIASESHQLSTSEDEDTCSSQEIAPSKEHKVISRSLDKHYSDKKRSPTKCVEHLRGCSTSPSVSMAINRTESFLKESGSNLKVDTTKTVNKKETPPSTKRKTSDAIDRKSSTSSSKSDNTPKNKHALHQSFEDLSAKEVRKVSRDAASCALDGDKHKESSLRKLLDTESPSVKLEKSPSFHARKSSHKTESVNLKKDKSTVANSSTSDSSIVKSLSDPVSSCSKPSFLDKQNKSSSNDQRPLCKYGAGCYRTNPIHLKEFRHSENSDTGVRKKEMHGADLGIKKSKSDLDMRRSNEDNVDMKPNSLLTSKTSPNKEPIENDSRSTLKRQSSHNTSNEPLLKKKKSDESSISAGDKSKGFAARLAASDPFRLFLTKSFSVPASHSDPLGCVLPDLLNRSLGTVLETVQFSFVVDLDFVFESYKACGLQDKPLLLLYGEMEGDTAQFSKGTFVKVSMPFLYGTHHTKLMLLLYTEGLRVVVHTANLRSDDWYEKTQGVWVSPLFPKMDVRPALPGVPPPGDSPTLFRQDLLQYLQSYKLAPLARWVDVVRRHDFAHCNAVFVGHVPGYHAGPALPFYGQLKLRRALGRHTSKDKWREAAALKGSTTVVQCSSIGSLGKDATWLSQDLGASLSGGQSCPASKVVVVYPSEEDVRLSSQGWMGGSCLPYQSGTHAKQPWLVKHLHHWRSDGRHRTRAMPHIKTYTRLLCSPASGSLSTSGCEAQYLLLTSANLSKAAWGQAQKQGAQLFIRSYEAGVLLLPKFVTGEESFPLNAPRSLTLPYDLPPTPYTSSDRPWLMDTNKKNKDVNGDTYP